MEECRRETAASILHLTLEMLYLLTGEGYVVKKGLNSTPHTSVPERSIALKIQELTNKIIELLTGEVCRYMEKCRDLGNDLPADHSPSTLADASPIKEEPRRCEEGSLRHAGADPPLSPLFKEELHCREDGRGDLTEHAHPLRAEPQREGAVDTDPTHQDQLMAACFMEDQSAASFLDLSAPTGHTADTPPFIKEVLLSAPSRHPGCAVLTVKEESLFSEEVVSDPDHGASSDLTEYNQVIVKEEPFSSEEDNVADVSHALLLDPPAGDEETDSGEEGSMDNLPSPGENTPSQGSCPTLSRPGDVASLAAAHNSDPNFRTCNVNAVTASIFKCHECAECFPSKGELSDHHLLHKRKKPHVCSHCGKSFSYQSQLLIHERTHTGEKPFTCADCGKCFNQLVHLGIHQMSHTGEKPFTCSECGKSFNRKTTLTIHQRVHTGEKPFYCPDCGKYFSTSSNLIKHQRVHTGEKPYACPDCGELFVHYTQLVRHQAGHTQPQPAAEKIFSCSECGECFTQKSQHIKHEKTHRDGSSGFPCAVCGQFFKQHKRFLSHQCVQDG